MLNPLCCTAGFQVYLAVNIGTILLTCTIGQVDLQNRSSKPVACMSEPFGNARLNSSDTQWPLFSETSTTSAQYLFCVVY